MSQNNIDDADLARRVCEHLAVPGEPTTPDDVREFIHAHNRIAEERHAAIQERDAARKRIDELLVTVKNLSLSTPYPEEAGSAATLIAEVGTLRAKLATAERERDEARSAAVRDHVDVDSDAFDSMAFERDVAVHACDVAQAEALQFRADLDAAVRESANLLATVQRESARVNEMTGVIAHLVGVLAEVHRATSIENARTFAELALANIEAWHHDAWKPGPSDDEIEKYASKADQTRSAKP